MKRMTRREYEAEVHPTIPGMLFNKVINALARNNPHPKWRKWLYQRTGQRIGTGANVGIDCFFDDQFPELTILEDDVSIGPRVMTVVHDDTQGGASGPGDFLRLKHEQMSLGMVGPVHIKQGAIIRPGVVLLPGVEVGEQAVVEAGSVVTRDVAAGAYVAGSPARFVADIQESKGELPMPVNWMTRDEYEQQNPRGKGRLFQQHLLLLLARFTIPTGWRNRLYRAMGANLGEHVYIGLDSILDPDFPELIYAADNSGFSIRVTFMTHDVMMVPDDAGTGPRRIEYVAPIRIGSRSWVAGGTVIMPGVTIGEDTIIGAGSVVTKDIPAGVVAAGNPARVIKQRDLTAIKTPAHETTPD